MNIRVVSRVCIALLVATGSVASIAQAPAAKAPAAKAPADIAVASGQAAGTLTAKGKTVKLTYAAAFVDQTDKAKRVVLVLSETPLPSSGWKSHSDLMSHHRNTSPIVGLVFRIDAAREVDTAEYLIGEYPTSTSGMFVLTFDGAPGKTYAGSLKSSAGAARMSDAVVANATFSATLK